MNFITRRGFDGLEVGGDYRFIDGSDGEYSLNALWGWSSQGGDMDFLLAAGMQHRSTLGTIDRDWALRSFAENPLGGWSTIANPGRFVRLPGGASINDPGCVFVGGACRFQFTPYDNLIEEEDRYQVYSEVNIDLNSSTEFHAEGLWARTEVPNWYTSPSYPPQVLTAQFVPNNHPGLLSLVASTGGAASPLYPLTAAGGGAANSLFIGRSFGFGGYPGSSASEIGSQTGFRNYEAFRISAGLQGRLDNGIGWNVTGTYMEDVGERLTYDTYIIRLADALQGRGGPNCVDQNPAVRGTQNASPGTGGCLYYNPFSSALPTINGVANPNFDPAVANTAELADWLTDPSYTEATTRLSVLDAVVDGELGWTMGGGAVGWAVGGQYRVDAYVLEANDNTNLAVTPCPDPLDTPGVGPCANATGPYAFLAGTLEADIDRSVGSVFAEMRFPFSENFEAILAARYENYEDAGSTFDPKLSLRWQTTPWLAFRGSVQTSFRGPTLAQLQGQFTTLQFVAPTNAFKAVDTFGNPNLDPETATSYNVGAIVETGGLTATLDYWDFAFEDPVIVEPFDAILTNVLATACGNALASRVVFSSGCTGANVVRIQTNIVNGPAIETSGVDASIEYRFEDFLSGELTLGSSASYQIEYIVDPLIIQGITLAPERDLSGQLNRGTGYRSMPDLKAELFANYAVGGHNFRIISRYISDYGDQRAGTLGIPAGFTIDSQWTYDLHYNWDTPWGPRLSASVINVTDEDPPLAYLDLNFDPYTHDPVGRVFRIGITQQFH